MDLIALQIILCICALFISGISKGISGLGLPVIAIPIFTALIDLQTAIVLLTPSTVVTDIIMALKFLNKDMKTIKSIIYLIVFGIIGMLIGTQLLVVIDLSILTGLLSVVVLLFVTISWFDLLPRFNKRPSKWIDATVGLVGGALQGATGSSGPIITIYLLQMKINRVTFLFIINSFFVITGVTQFLRLLQLNLYYVETIKFSLVSFIPVFIGLLLSFKIQKYITEFLFKKLILILIGISGVILAYKSFIL